MKKSSHGSTSTAGKSIPVLLLPLLFILLGTNRGYCQISYTPLYSSGSFSNPTNILLAVGATEGSASVAQSGAATYNIPISCPPGTNGFAPKISLSYNSLAGNGDLGMGWNISGLSSITRKPKTYFFDGTVAPISYTNADALALDGVQLISAGGGSYRTEDYDFSSITAYGVSGYGADHFVAVRKDGSIWEYGNTWDSKLYPSVLSGTFPTPLSWRLNKITDINGNYITFNYSSTGWESHISEIDYTGNASTGLGTYNKIAFNYSTGRIDPNRMYDDNAFLDITSLLTSVTVTGYGGPGYKTYELGYGNDGVNSYLKSITEKDGSGNRLNPTIFRYGDVPSTFASSLGSLPGIPSFADDYQRIFTCDFNGDGLQDVVVVQKWPVGGGSPLYYDYSMNVYTRTYGSGTYSAPCWIPLPHTFSKVDGVTVPNNYSFQTADFNGDGYEDILVTDASYTGSESWITVQGFDVWHGSPSASCLGYMETAFPTPWVGSDNYNVVSPTGDQIVYPGDFDGDGICDFVTFLSDEIGYKAFMYNGTTASGTAGMNITEIGGMYGGGYYAPTSFYHNSKIYVGDFDGDGKSELMVVTSSGTQIWTFTKSGGTFTGSVIYSGGYPVTLHDVYLGDFNGDGKTDIFTRIGSTYTSSLWQIGFSLGNSAGFAVQNFTFTNVPQQDESIVVADFNSDGKSDILLKRNGNNTLSSNWFDIYFNQGSMNFNLASSGTYYGPCTAQLLAADLDGDGRPDLLNLPKAGCGMSGTLADYTFSIRNRGQEQVMQGVIDGMNRQTTFNYDNMTSNVNYTEGSGSTYPLNDYVQPMYLVTSIVSPDGIGGTTQTNYGYTGEIVHKLGKGLLGFGKVTQTNLTTNIYTEQNYGLNGTYLARYPTSSASNQLGTGLTSNSYTYSFLGSGYSGGYYYKNLTNSTESNLLTGATKTTSISYDGYGNPTSATVNNSGQETVTTNNTYVTAGSEPVPASVSTSVKTTTRTGQPPVTVETDYTYDAHGNVATETDNVGTGLYTIKSYLHDPYGNITQLTTTGAGITSGSPVYNYAYDGTGRFIVSTTNPLGQVSTAAYDPVWGHLTSSTGIDGNTTTFNYDTWGNRTATNMPEGYSISYSRFWASSPTPTRMWVSIMNHPGKPDEEVGHDIFGRETSKIVEAWGYASTTVNTTYDADGNVASKTKPFIAGSETPFTTSYSYNSLDQSIGTSDPFGSSSCSYSYSGGNTTLTLTDAGGHVTKKVIDATQKVTSATDGGGTLTYTYDGFGNLLQVKNSYILITNTYDAAGRMASCKDIDAGLTTYVYDAFGRLQSQTDPIGNVVNFNYDIFNRVTSRTGTEGTTTYSYFTSGGGINKKKHVTAFSGVTDDYTYDAFGRPTSNTKTIAGTAFTTSTDFDMYDNVSDMTYASGLYVSNAYDANSYLTDVYAATGVGAYTENVFSASNMNGSGEYTSYTLGNGLTSTNTYNYWLPTNRSTPGVQNLTISYDYANGLVTKRYDAMVNNQEVFTYDALNRLTSSAVTHLGTGAYSLPAVGISYSSTGNITSKSDVGTMVYGLLGATIHAVSDVADVSGDISVLRQKVKYTPFNKASTLLENGYEEDITYDADYNRVMGVLKHGSTIVNTRYYLPNCEYNVPGTGAPQYVNYIQGGDGLAAISSGTTMHLTYVIFGGLWIPIFVPAPTCYYTYKDQQGSILSVTNDAGTVVAKQNFDAWGRFRNTTNWTYLGYPYTTPGTPSWLYRGYTGHEHLPQFDLINMNGRMYDPVLSRMLRPDNYIQAPFNSQNYNRFTYCLNNPATYTDPTGNYYGWDDAIVAGIGFAVGFIGEAAATHNWSSWKTFKKGWKKDVEAGLVGAAIAELSYYGAESLTVGYAAMTPAIAHTAVISFGVGYGVSTTAMLLSPSTQSTIAAANNHTTNIGIGKMSVNDGLLYIAGIEAISGAGYILGALSEPGVLVPKQGNALLPAAMKSFAGAATTAGTTLWKDDFNAKTGKFGGQVITKTMWEQVGSAAGLGFLKGLITKETINQTPTDVSNWYQSAKSAASSWLDFFDWQLP